MSSERPAATLALYQRIRFDIEENILSGSWPPGHRIPFEHELMARYHCSRMTVSKVLSALAAAGLVERRRRTGTFVARPRAHSAVLHIPDVQAEVEGRGERYGYQLLSSKRRQATAADRKQLGKRVNDDVLALRCLHSANNKPFAFEMRLLNLTAVPPAAEQDFSRVAPGRWLLDQVPWTEAEHYIFAREPENTAATSLGLKAQSACLVLERRTWRGDETITFAQLTFPGDLYHLVARFAPAQGTDPTRFSRP